MENGKWALKHQKFYLDRKVVKNVFVGEIEIGDCLPLLFSTIRR